MPRTKGSVNRNYPSVSLLDALEIPRAIQNGASGMPVSKLTLAELVGRSPAASQFRERVFSSRAYGLTTGGVNADQFELTQLGDAATGGDEVARDVALKQAVLNIEPFRTFLTAYDSKAVPTATPLKEYLVQSASVPAERAAECAERVLGDADFVGFLRVVSGKQYIDLKGSPAKASVGEADEEVEDEDDPDDDEEQLEEPQDKPEKPLTPLPSKKVFIAHGKNRVPLDQLKSMLDQFKVKYAVAVDEPNQGRPISSKVAALMSQECSSGIFIFTADEKFLVEEADGTHKEIWRPSENVVYELGAASVLYDRRIVIFKEKDVTFPSDFNDLGYIEFEQGELASQMGSLFGELVALDILEVRAKG